MTHKYNLGDLVGTDNGHVVGFVCKVILTENGASYVLTYNSSIFNEKDLFRYVKVVTK